MARLTLFVSALAVSLLFSILPSYAQTTITDIENNPVAQDILRKIEQTKQWIEELEQRNYEDMQKQQELEQKRAEALANLNQDLKEWEALWAYYSPYNSFERFVDKIPDSQVQSVFWDQFEFKEQKVNAGRDAFRDVLESGGTRYDALDAYLTAAETKRIELIEANSQFNIRHNLAYYNQQILFDAEGKFIDSPVTGEQLRKYYEDYKTNPDYLAANPDDALSWDALGKTRPDTQCREGQTVIHRLQADDYVCVSVETAEMWIRHGMGEIMGNMTSNSPDLSVSPITKCNDGLVVVYTIESGIYSCVSESTADLWISQGIAEIHDPEQYIKASIEKKESHVEIQEINQQIRDMNAKLQQDKIDFKLEYDKKYDDAYEQLKSDEHKATQDYNERSGMSKEELSTKIFVLRENYEDQKEQILKDKILVTQTLEREYDAEMAELVKQYDSHPLIKIVLKTGGLEYEAVLRS